MAYLIPILFLAGAAAVIGVAWRNLSIQRAVLERLFDEESEADALRDSVPHPPVRPAVRRSRWIPWTIGAIVAGGLWLFTGLSLLYLLTFGVIVALLGGQLEFYLFVRKNLILETQLAEAIDMIVGALGAGAGATAGLVAAVQEVRRPLKPLLEEVLARIQYGDDPQAVFQGLSERVPLETFLLFCSTLSVHWETGGSLTSTLATVGRTIRDRIEMSRRIRSNSLQAQISVVVVLLVTYFIAVVMWRTNPEQMQTFLSSPTASWFIAGSMLLQAIGIVWISHLSRMKF